MTRTVFSNHAGTTSPSFSLGKNATKITVDTPFLLASPDADIPSGRTIAAGDGITITENATAAAFVISLSPNVSFSVRYAFADEALTAGSLTVTHNLNQLYPTVQIYNDSNEIIIPDRVISVSANTTTIDLSSFGTLSGTWHAVFTN